MAGGLGAMLMAKKPASAKDADAGDEASEGAMIAQDVLDAIKAGDAAGLDQALRSHYAVCSGGEDAAEPAGMPMSMGK